MKPYLKPLAVVLSFLFLIAGILVYLITNLPKAVAPSQAPAVPSSAPTGAASPNASRPASTPAPSPVRASAPAVHPPRPSFPKKILSPLPGAQWVIGQSHAVSWDAPAQMTGAVYLVSAATNKTAGWITSETGPQATSFTWNTSDLYLARYGGVKTEVPRGSYRVAVMFDRSQTVLQSGVFSVVYPEEVTAATRNVSLNNLAASPRTLTVKQGDTIVFTDNDPVLSYQLVSPSIFGPYALAPGQSISLTITLNPGTYAYTDELHAGVSGTIVVTGQ